MDGSRSENFCVFRAADSGNNRVGVGLDVQNEWKGGQKAESALISPFRIPYMTSLTRISSIEVSPPIERLLSFSHLQALMWQIQWSSQRKGSAQRRTSEPSFSFPRPKPCLTKVARRLGFSSHHSIYNQGNIIAHG